MAPPGCAYKSRISERMEAKFANVALSRSQATPDTCKRFHEALGAPMFFFGGGRLVGEKTARASTKPWGPRIFWGSVCGKYAATGEPKMMQKAIDR